MLRLFGDYRMAGDPRYYVSDKPEHLMRVPDQIKKCVMFVLYRNEEGETILAGTAFLVGMPDKEAPKDFVYCVTARHVIANIHKHSRDLKIILRINKHDGSFENIETDFYRWQYHPDDNTVDVAVLPYFPSPRIFDVVTIHFESAVTQPAIKQANIGIGDEVFITGLFTQHSGIKRNLPIIRVGNIAMMSEEGVSTEIFGKIEAYLIEARSIGGLSGSPVFVQKSGVQLPEGGGVIFDNERFHWLGLIHGHWDIKSTAQDEAIVDGTLASEGKVNMGIAIVVPATKILEVLNQPILTEQREEERKRFRGANAPTPDSNS
jgi:hypothetical protein